MKKEFILSLALLVLSAAGLKAQVTVGANKVPRATLDVVVADPATATTAVGIIAPNLTGVQIQALTDANVYGTDQTGVIVYVTSAVAAPAGKTVNITAAGYYYFDGSVWQPFGGKTSSSTVQGNVTTVSTAAYTVKNTDYLIYTTGPACTITFPASPAFTAADAGKTIVVFNNNADGTSANTVLGVNLGNPANNFGRGLILVWTGTAWAAVSFS